MGVPDLWELPNNVWALWDDQVEMLKAEMQKKANW